VAGAGTGAETFAKELTIKNPSTLEYDAVNKESNIKKLVNTT
jgi:hypothetical protein